MQLNQEVVPSKTFVKIWTNFFLVGNTNLFLKKQRSQTRHRDRDGLCRPKHQERYTTETYIYKSSTRINNRTSVILNDVTMVDPVR